MYNASLHLLILDISCSGSFPPAWSRGSAGLSVVAASAFCWQHGQYTLVWVDLSRVHRSFGPVVIWSSSHLVQPSFGPAVIWSSRTSSMMVLTVAVMAAHTAAPGSAGWWVWLWVWLWVLTDNWKLPSLRSITAALHGLTFRKGIIKLVK